MARIVAIAAAVAAIASLMLCIAPPPSTAYPLKNCTSDADFIADDTDLCIFYRCHYGVPANNSCPKGTRLPSYYDIGVDNPCTINVINSKCCRCDTNDSRPVAVAATDYCQIWKSFDLCQSGCTCVNEPDGYSCDCKTPVTPPPALPTVPYASVVTCAVNICLNGGTCQKLYDEKPFCKCPAGYTGDVCEHLLCDYNPCKNGGHCVSNGTGIRCECAKCYIGTCCEERDLDDPDCRGCGPCAAGANCSSVRTWLCSCNECPEGFLCSDTPRNTVRRCSKASAAASDKFTLMFEENWTTDGAALEIYCTAGEDDNVPRLVSVTAPLGSVNCNFNDTRTIRPGEVYKFNVPLCLRHDGTGKRGNGILVKELNGNTITVYAINRATFSADSWLCLPDATAGTSFVIVSYQGYQEYKSQFGIVAFQNNTNVTIYLSTATDVSGTSPGSVINLILNAYETYQVQAVLLADVSATLVESSKPVHVVAGHVRSYVGPGASNPLSSFSGGASRDHLVEEIVPTDYWGITYAIVPVPRNVINYTYTEEIIRIVGYTTTQCTLYSTSTNVQPQTIALSASTRFLWQTYVNADANYFVSCTNPVLVMELTESALQGISLYDDPALIYVPAVSQYSNFYKFAPPIYSVSGLPYLYMFAKLASQASDYASVTINSAVPSPLKSWARLNVPSISDASNYPSLYAGVFFLPRNATSTIRHPSTKVKFMCIIYAFDNRESIGHAAGTSLSTTNAGVAFDVTSLSG